MRRTAVLLAIIVSLIGAPSVLAAPTVTDVFARSATRAMIATRFGIGSVGVQRNVHDLTCHRLRASSIRCGWSLGPNQAPLMAFGIGQVTMLAPAAPGAPPRYRYDFAGKIGRRVTRRPLRYRVRSFHWRYTSPDKAAWATRVAHRFQTAADAEVTDYFNRSGATGSPVPNPRPCSWSLLDDRTVAATCSATYNAQSGGRSCRLTVGGNWAEGALAMTVPDSSDCDGPPG